MLIQIELLSSFLNPSQAVIYQLTCLFSVVVFLHLNRPSISSKPINCAQIRTKGAFVSSPGSPEIVSYSSAWPSVKLN